MYNYLMVSVFAQSADFLLAYTSNKANVFVGLREITRPNSYGLTVFAFGLADDMGDVKINNEV